jgi:hypothetical protein
LRLREGLDVRFGISDPRIGTRDPHAAEGSIDLPVAVAQEDAEPESFARAAVVGERRARDDTPVASSRVLLLLR